VSGNDATAGKTSQLTLAHGMKPKLLGLVLLLLAALAVPAQTRSLVLQSGTNLEAQVLSIGLDSVTIRRAADGKVYSLPLAYLSASNRLELVAERAKQWQPIEVYQIEGSASAGRYQRCRVRGTNVSETILVQLLPPSIEAILNNRNQQAAQIAVLADRVEQQDWNVQRADATTPHSVSGDSDYVAFVMAQRARVNLAIVDLNQAKTNLFRLEQAYADYCDRTRAATIVQMKNTGLVYDGLQVWECFDPRKHR